MICPWCKQTGIEIELRFVKEYVAPSTINKSKKCYLVDRECPRCFRVWISWIDKPNGQLLKLADKT